ncbi:MAG: ATP-dependent RecD-like DNA helicase [Lachnospiraceae bacterium]|nr:ATP-dependent RecD-like DNA helicase [Lachnospiraceae bacterium]
MDKAAGYVDRIIYRSEDTGYTVLALAGEEEVTLVGALPMVSVGEYIEAEGELKEHPAYGPQLAVTSYEVTVPQNTLAVERYLGSGAVRGVGAALAARIVMKFKGDTMRILEEEPERLAEVRGISERKAAEIAEQVIEKKELRQAVMFLQGYGITLKLAVKIWQTYGNGIYTIIRENPYRLAEGVSGIGFKIADEIAKKAGIHADSDFRIRSGILYTLQEALGEGHMYLPRRILMRRVETLLGVELPSIERHLTDMMVERRLVVKDMPAPEVPREAPDEREYEAYYEESLRSDEERQAVYASGPWYTEMSVARRLVDLSRGIRGSAVGIRAVLARVEKTRGMQLEERQREAIRVAAENGVTVITGGPGTGKTTTICALLSYFESEGLEVLLAAPTGRAAKRMTEATGAEARTIHRLLEVSGGPGMEDAPAFGRNEDTPLEADAIIVDEMSMVDIYLMHALLKAIPVGTRLILVGDENQLPSVGPGNVLKDIIASGAFPVVELTKIFRQEEAGDIVVNAHRIQTGEPVDLAKKSRDFLFIRRPDAASTLAAAVTLVRDKLPPYVGADPSEIQVLTPMRKGPMGSVALNAYLQEAFNPPAPGKAEHAEGDVTFREGDKVMQIKNDYQLAWEVRGKYGLPIESGAGVFNGDIGVVREVNTFTEEMTVEFDDRRTVVYPFKSLEELELAYAITIHKAQGSEYPAAVIPLLAGPRMLMTRNLLYTAVTRARKCICLVGSAETFYAMAANTAEQRRYSGLALQITSCAEGI